MLLLYLGNLKVRICHKLHCCVTIFNCQLLSVNSTNETLLFVLLLTMCDFLSVYNFYFCSYFILFYFVKKCDCHVL